ncbi:sugar ABC transporter substrate-binding protein [Cohnella nanjingensis]|uniref:Carbohydrate ABC transporter substrate-binding protein n=1 Tax=Cohnella nanjingensis TaxID=1387779 RepID=A0A7X0VHS8_9BACL|nr:ABC transporter substrate-binding protein [Cohnella nanjingensis]MBB6674231.1 carbohydrate ABC transporter substrate-binding protein [Cohnella nanjingensis]
MKKVKKVSILLTATAMVGLLAACGSSTDGNKESGSPAASGTSSAAPEKLKKISLFQSKVEIAESLEALAKTYKKETGNDVEVWGSAGDAYATQLQAKLAAGEGPTIFSVATGAEADKFKSYYADLSGEPFAKDIAKDMALTDGGKVVGVPYGVEGFGLVYNKSLVDPKDVTDLASFTKTLEKVKADGKNGFSLSQEAYFLIGHIINTPFALQADPQDFIAKLNKGEVKMADTKEFQEFAKFMEAIKANSPNPMEVKYDTQMGDFATGKTAMVHQGNWSYGMLKDYGDLGFDVGMMGLPLAGNDKIAVGVASNWVVNGKADADQIKAAKGFLNWMLTSDSGKNAIVNEFKFIPAMTNIEAANLDPLSQTVYEATKNGQTIPWALNYFPQGIIVNDLAPATQAFFLDKKMTGEQFLKNLDAAWAKGAK